SIHLYLGCFFAPILLFFIVTGCLQTFHLHESRKDGSYQASALVQAASEVHLNQRTGVDGWPMKSSKEFQLFVLLMSVGILTTTILGIVMAFKYTKPWIVWSCLAAGIVIPIILLRFAHS